MKNKVEVKILNCWREGQKAGDSTNMKREDAIKYEKEGIVKILNSKAETKKVFKQRDSITCDSLIQIIERQKELEGDNYLEVFAGDDKKTAKNIMQKRFNVNEANIEDIKNTIKEFNKESYGVFFNYNPTDKPQRLKVNIKKILYVFIDLDDANEEHNETIKATLKEYNITYSYNAKSGHGYHFLIPVFLEPDKELNVKAFLKYLKDNVCEKVDVATYTNERLFRVPESMHNKDQESKKLITLHSHKPSEDEITQNNGKILSIQSKDTKKKINIKYESSIKRDDSFFSVLLSNTNSWNQYKKLLNKAESRNDIFVKNLGIFVYQNNSHQSRANLFLENWEKSRLKALGGWMKKAKETNMNVNYYELYTWSKKHNLDLFLDLLDEQIKEKFLDCYEIYYLEAEKSENNCLLYYPEKNYYIQKSIYEVILNIYYDCKEKGIDLVEELNLNILYDKWDEFNFKKQMGLILDQIRRCIEKENRIKLIYNMNYEPSDRKFIDDENKRFFNIYNKSTYWDYKKDQKKYGFPHIKELIMNLCGNEQESYDYFNKWLGWIIQNPLEKLPTAIIFQGRQGSGKGQFKSNILDNIFGDNCQEINQTHLESSFNEYLLGKQIIIANEVMHNENRQTLPNVLKNLVTDEKITIQRKFRTELVCKNYTHWIFCTNNDNPIKIDEDDRRYSVFYSEKLKGGGKKAAEFIKELRTNLEFELKEYISYLKSLKIDYIDVHEPIMTKAKEDIVDLNKDSIERFIEYLNNFPNIKQGLQSLESVNYSYVELDKDSLKYILTDVFYLGYEAYCSKFKERGIFNKQTFAKKLISKSIEKEYLYFQDLKSSKRVYDLSNIQEVLIK